MVTVSTRDTTSPDASLEMRIRRVELARRVESVWAGATAVSTETAAATVNRAAVRNLIAPLPILLLYVAPGVRPTIGETLGEFHSSVSPIDDRSSRPGDGPNQYRFTSIPHHAEHERHIRNGRVVLESRVARLDAPVRGSKRERGAAARAPPAG